MIPIAYNLGSLNSRRTTTATAVIGIALVVFVLAAALMLSSGIRKTLGSTGKPDVGMVIRKGSDAELSSNFDLANVSLILDGPEVRRNPEGKAIGVGEVVVVAAMDKIGTAVGIANVNVRGVPDNVMQMRPTVKIVEGRAARPGTDEAICGSKIRGRFKGLQLGEKVQLKKNRPVEIVGIFDDDGTSFESEVWTDVDALRSMFGRESVVSSVRVQLTGQSSFEAFKNRIEGDKRLGLEAMRESKYYEKQSENLAMFLGVLGTLTAFFFSIGAMIGAMITMYAMVSSRSREVGTLRAIGFSRLSVLATFLLEAVLISLLGGLLGGIASLALGMVKFSVMNFATWSEIVFTFHPTPEILIVSTMAAVIMGVFGGFLPAVQAARLSPILAMRGE
ncbi:MAG: ABC transporter permease [Planctomycetota bacterium]